MTEYNRIASPPNLNNIQSTNFMYIMTTMSFRAAAEMLRLKKRLQGNCFLAQNEEEGEKNKIICKH